MWSFVSIYLSVYILRHGALNNIFFALEGKRDEKFRKHLPGILREGVLMGLKEYERGVNESGLKVERKIRSTQFLDLLPNFSGRLDQY